MILKMYTIRDAKIGAFRAPFFQNTHGEAERSFMTAVNDPQSQLHAYPEDFDLYYLGDYDDQSGTFQGLDTPQHVAKAITVVKKPRVSPVDVSASC